MSAEHASTPPPLFETPTVAINYLSDHPEGFTFVTRSALGRTEQLDGPVSYKEVERQQLSTGMSRETDFSGATALRELRDAYLHPATPLSYDERTHLRAKYDKERADYRKRGKKAGLVAISQSSENILTADVKIVPYPVYRDFTTYEASDDMRTLSRAAGVAAIVRTADNRLIVQHRAVETVKLQEPGKTPGNAVYSDQPGASIAGLMDSTLRGQGRRPGTPDPINNESIRAMTLKEAGEELGLAPDDLTQLRLVGVASDRVRPHDELLLVADSRLTAGEVYETSKSSVRNKELSEVDLEEKFFDIEASPQAIETLLCDVKCPLPPTHAAALVAAGYLMKIEQGSVEEAIRWRNNLQHRFAENYQAIDGLVRDFYDTFPEAALQVPERYWKHGAPPRDQMGYDPRYTPQEQGLPAFDDEMVRTGLLPETRTTVDTAYLLDVDGVLTDPAEKRTTDEVLDALAQKLTSGAPVGFNTGRSTQWVVKNVINPLLARTGHPDILKNAVVIGEKGTTWALFDEQGQPQYGKVESLVIPEDLSTQISDIMAKYDDSMANLDPKTTMFSIEMLDGHDLDAFHAAQAELANELRTLLQDTGQDDTFRVDETTIATDVESPYVGKALGTDRFMEFLRLRGIKAGKFEAFGDSPSDMAMADELARRGQTVSMRYVGDPSKLPAKNRRYSVVTKPGYIEGTVAFLREN